MGKTNWKEKYEIKCHDWDCLNQHVFKLEEEINSKCLTIRALNIEREIREENIEMAESKISYLKKVVDGLRVKVARIIIQARPHCDPQSEARMTVLHYKISIKLYQSLTEPE